jgi:hypothetical protein
VTGLVLVLTLTALQAASVQAASVPAAPGQAPPDVVRLEDVEVLARRGRALVDPEVELDGAEIDALGADDIGAVIRRTAEDYGLGPAPMIVVNGRRMADPGVFSGFPPDALVRLEVLPPEAGALYGAADPSRRVVNIVLQRRFDSLEGRGALKRPSAGGQSQAGLDLRRGSIIDARTRQLGVRAGRTTALYAGERDLTREAAPGGEAATLRPPSQTYAADLVQTWGVGDWSASLRANAQAQDSRSVSISDGRPVDNRRSGRSLALTGGLNGAVAGWSTQVSVNGQLSRGDQSGLTSSRSDQRTLSGGLALSRSLFDLPAGPLTANLSAQASRTRAVTRRAQESQTSAGRALGLSGGLAFPLARRPPQATGPGLPGDLTGTLGGDLSESDTGRGEGLNAGLAWSPAPKLRVNLSGFSARRNMTDPQRFEPEYYGDPVVVFDFARGESVEVLPILGGTSSLRTPRSERLMLSAAAGPFTPLMVQGGMSFERAETFDDIAAPPAPTPQLEAAFPERFRRDASGRLVSVDQRALNIRSALSESLSGNLTAAAPLGGEGARRGVLRVNLNYGRQLTSRTTIHEALPELDRLSGDGGGLSPQSLGLSINVRQGRWGLNLAGRWRDGYRFRRDIGRDGPDDLRIAPFSAVSLQATRRFDQVVSNRDGGERRGVGLEVELEIANLFDARPKARLGDGRPAPGYGRDDQDPIGRTVQLRLKRRF